MIVFHDSEDNIIGRVSVDLNEGLESVAEACAKEARHLASIGYREWTAVSPEVRSYVCGHSGDGIIARYEAGSSDHGHWLPESPEHWLRLWTA